MADAGVFDGAALIEALDTQRVERGLNWNQLADELWRQSAEASARISDQHLCPGALVRTAQRGTMSCQYALILLRWIRRPPEEFVVGAVADVEPRALPAADADELLRWDLAGVHAALDARRRERGLTWGALADELDCTPSRLTNLRTARLADMGLVMRVIQWLGRPAADFVHAVRV